MSRRNNRRRTVRLRESAPNRAASTISLVEAGSPLDTAGCGKNRRYRACLIQGDRWGTAGYYPADMLATYGPQAWPTGTQMYLDHPGLADEANRPERSVRDLAGTIASTPEYQTSGPQGQGLYADVQVYPHAASMIEAMSGDIGLSIRAAGTAEPGNRGGRSGMVITSISPDPSNSVDYVTRAGAGGKLVALLESARTTKAEPGAPIAVAIREAGSIGAWFEALIHSEFTEEADDQYGWGQLTRSERIALSSAIGDALDAFVARLQADAPQLYERDKWGDMPTGPSEEIAVAESATTSSVPAPPVEIQPTREETPMSGDDKAGLGQDERIAALEKRLVESERRADEADRLLAEARLAGVRSANTALASAAARRFLESEGLDPAIRQIITPVVEAAAVAQVAALDVPADEAKLAETVTAAGVAERDRVAKIVEAAGVREPGTGATAQKVTAGSAQDAAASTAALIESYRAQGLSERAATMAATGRAI